MNQVRYHTTLPSNLKDQYAENDTVDFVMVAPSRKIIGGTVRLTGEIMLGTNLPTDYATTARFDPFTGAHSFVDNITTTTQLQGQIETISEYARWVSTKAQATLSKDDVCTNSVYLCEARCSNEGQSQFLLKGYVTADKITFDPNNIPATRKNLDFSLKLDFCLNNMMGDNLLPYAKTGDIRVSLQLPPTPKALFSYDTTANVSYKLKNLRLTFQSVVDDGKYEKQYQMQVKYNIKQSILSSFSNVSVKAPIVASAVVVSFLKQDYELDGDHNNCANMRPPAIDEIQFLWNDSTNQLITYTLDNQEEYIYNYLKALNTAVGANNCHSNTLASNSGFGLGLNFNMAVDLSQTVLSFNMRSAIQNTDPFSAYVYFIGMSAI